MTRSLALLVAVALLWLLPLAPGRAEEPAAGGHTIQTPGEIQAPTGPWLQPKPIQVPKGTWQVPGEIQVPRGIEAVKEERGGSGCEERIAVLADALFDFDQAELRPDAVETLDVVGPMLRQGTPRQGTPQKVTVEGYTDAKGGDSYNQRLSERRAVSVRDWLRQRGYVTAAGIRGYGKARPVAANTRPDGSDDPEGRQKNRRVEILVDRCA